MIDQSIIQTPWMDATGDDAIRIPLDRNLREARAIFEREYLRRQIDRHGGNITKTAQFVGMERAALHRKLKSLDIRDFIQLPENTYLPI